MTVFSNFKDAIDIASKRELKEIADRVELTGILNEQEREKLRCCIAHREQIHWFNSLPEHPEPRPMPYVHFGSVRKEWQRKMLGCIKTKCKYCL